MLEDENNDGIYLMFGMKQIPDKPIVKPIRIPLKHPFKTEGVETCLFTKDPQADFKALLKTKSVQCVTKVWFGLSIRPRLQRDIL